MRRIFLVTACALGLIFLALHLNPPSVVTKAKSEQGEKRSTIVERPARKHQTLDPVGIQRLKNDTGRNAKVVVSGATGGARFVSFAPGVKGDLMKSSRASSASAKSADFINEYGSIFGLKNANAELRLKEQKDDPQGNKHLSFR